MDGATEAEDYQAVGIKCRDALIAVAKEDADSEWARRNWPPLAVRGGAGPYAQSIHRWTECLAALGEAVGGGDRRPGIDLALDDADGLQFRQSLAEHPFRQQGQCSVHFVESSGSLQQ